MHLLNWYAIAQRNKKKICQKLKLYCKIQFQIASNYRKFTILHLVALLLIAINFILVFPSVVIAQSDSIFTGKNEAKHEAQFSIGLGAQHGFIFAHSQDVQNTSGARPTGIEALLSWQRNDSAAFALCHCYPRQGLMIAFYDYDIGLLGKSATAAYYLEPTFRINDRLLFSLKAAAGLSYLNNPYDSIENPANQSYSTNLSIYLRIGIGFWVQLSEKWWLNPSVNYQHISNGGLRDPNKGINWPTAGISVSYQPDFRSWYKGKKNSKKYWREYSPRFNFSMMGAMLRGVDQDGNRKRYFMGGMALQAAKQVGSLSVLTLGAEVYRDSNLEEKLRREGIDASPTKAGLMLGHEFLLGSFRFSQRLGFYVFDQIRYYDRLFHRWGIMYQVNRYLSTGINLLAHRQVAEFLDFRLTYSLQKKYQ